MKSLTALFCLSLAFTCATSLYGDVTVSVIANAGTGKFQLPDSDGDLPGGSTYAFGVLDQVGFENLANYSVASLLSVFDVYGSFTFNSAGEVAALGQPLSGGTQGDPLSALIYTPGGGEVGLFSSTNGLWDYPADSGAATLSNTLIDIAFVGELSTLTLVSAVPEPETYGAILGLLACGLVVYRRRRESV